mmetsp:Transcript_35528/g.111148  ORF Transcript_35528/g.111148 Transcript_35528/m.111148 type:complete len:430 (+) Transcript_35528:2901-4190(+)
MDGGNPHEEAQASTPIKDGEKKKRPEVIKWANLMQDQKLRPEHVKLMVVGESGLGKTTSIRCILHRYGESELDGMQDMTEKSKTLEIREYPPVTIQTDDPWEGSGLPSRHLVSACLYFIAPHRLKTIDIDFMREVSRLIPIIPVIAKSDTMTRDETLEFRRLVAAQLSTDSKIRLYPWTVKTADGVVGRDETLADDAEMPPFTIIAAKNFEYREYAWGTCRLDDRQHSDFTLLRRLVLGRHLLSLKQEALDTFSTWKKQKEGRWMPTLLFTVLPSSIAFRKVILDLFPRYRASAIWFLVGIILVTSILQNRSLSMENRAVQTQIEQLGRNNTELMVEMLKWKEEAQKVSQTCKSKAANLTRNSESQISSCRAELVELQHSLKQVMAENKKLEEERAEIHNRNSCILCFVSLLCIGSGLIFFDQMTSRHV